MRRPVFFLGTAVRRLREIRSWTERRFGPEQADRYEALLRSRIEATADGRAHATPANVVTGQPGDADVSLVRAGEHFLVLRIRPERIELLDVLHSRSDLIAHLTTLPKDET